MPPLKPEVRKVVDVEVWLRKSPESEAHWRKEYPAGTVLTDIAYAYVHVLTLAVPPSWYWAPLKLIIPAWPPQMWKWTVA